MIQRLALLAVVILSGCDLYWHNGGDDVCAYGALVPSQELRNPQTGDCQPFGGGGCNNACGPCAEPAAGAMPNWGACYGACEGLAETACLATTGCHAAYFPNPLADTASNFWSCWEVAPAAAHEGSCALLDAQGCSERDDCVSNFISPNNTATTHQFQSCSEESPTLCVTDSQCGADGRCDTTTCHSRPCPTCPTCGQCAPDDTCYGVCVPKDPNSCDTVDCGAGAHCQEQCYPCDTQTPGGCMSQCQPMCIPDTTCASVDCGPGYTCEETCSGGANGQPGTCYPQCVPTHNDPGSCTGNVSCAMPPPACPVGSTAGIANGCYTGYCIPNADCTPHDPGSCYGQVSCLTGQPACPTGTVAGIANGCWTGYCIPQQDCPPAPCESLATEASCQSRNDCIPVYDGMNCTCYPDHCECESQTYARCESALAPL
jgi:hypothetical protein